MYTFVRNWPLPAGAFQGRWNNWKEINRLRIPNGRRQTSWLSTSAAEELNQGLPLTNPASGQSGTWTRISRYIYIYIFIIQLSYTVRIPIFWLVDLYYVTLVYDATTSLTWLSWCNSRGVNSIHHCHCTIALADSKFDDFCLRCIQYE